MILFAVLMLVFGGVSAARPEAVSSYSLRFVGQRKSFAAAHPRLTLSGIRASGIIALLMGATLLYVAFMAK